MTWIKTIPASEDEEVRRVVEAQRELYPIEYATPFPHCRWRNSPAS